MFIRRLKSASSSANREPCFNLRVADTLYKQFMGLMFKPGIEHDQGLLIKDCNWVHTMFMRFSIDVLYLDGTGKVVAVKRLKPFRLSMPVWGAVQVVEIQAGTAEYYAITAGDMFVAG
ncbi:MAG: DUF192 domain-containing protein [Deltaproteobacteria bacterium]|nr:DUF192 domain-containing protein [Deltaproteobacteria bacterium]MCL5878354.1 DUF192 domain-containing protein [Deltaproteobacteria bacterium]